MDKSKENSRIADLLALTDTEVKVKIAMGLKKSTDF